MVRISFFITIIFLFLGGKTVAHKNYVHTTVDEHNSSVSESDKYEVHMLASGKKSTYRIVLDPMASESE